ncbi:MAG: hypothetical protein RI990_1147 [Planctomycetota bacterium]|jgi:ABC-type transporter Mla subunit MlaD
MADGSGYPNSIRAGAFLLTAAATALVIILVLSKSAVFSSKSRYVVRFGMDDGVSGLDVGSEVRVAGLKVGRVTHIDQKFDSGWIDVGIEIRADIALHEGVQVLRSQPLLGNYSWLNFPNLGSANGARIEPGATIEAQKSGGLLATIVGPSNAGRADQMFTNLVEFTDSLANFARVQYPENVVPLLQEARTLMADLGKDYGEWRGKVGEAIDGAASSMAKLDSVMDDAAVGVKDARAVVEHFRANSLAQVDKILEDGVKGADRFADAMDTLEAELSARLPDVRALLWDLRQAGAQVKLATMEVRRSPWKLLYRPSGDELARENLYESARAFAIASSDLRVAGETLDMALRDSPKRFEDDPEFRGAVRDGVMKAIGRYETAQQRLFDVLQADFGGEAAPEGAPTVAPPVAAPAPKRTEAAPAAP